MSEQRIGGSRLEQLYPTVPRGTEVAVYDTYQAAASAIDTLVEREFPVDKVSVIGSELRSIERITTGLSYPKAALSGLASGLWFGLFLGLIMVIWSPTTGLNYLFAALVLGAGFGIISGVATYAFTRRYSLVVTPEVAGQAQSILGTYPQQPAQPQPPQTPQP
jgi:hypothetical protein